MAKDYYGLLGVSPGASDTELKRAYRKLAREYHPDINPDPHAQEQFKEITLAYEILSDPERRRIVDAGGDPLQRQGMGGFGFTGGLGDVFEAFFGGMSRNRGPKGRVQPGEDARTQVEITLEECAAGVNKEITVDTAVLCESCQGSGSQSDGAPIKCATCHGQGEIQQLQRSILGQIMTSRPCPDCKGAGCVIPDPCEKCEGEGRVLARRTITATIPAGVSTGVQIRLSGQGEVGRGGGGAGDLYVEILEEAHPIFIREDEALHVIVQVPMVDASLGSHFTLTSVLGEELTVDIPEGTQTGSIITIRGQGMPKLRSAGRGPLHVHIEVTIPKKLDHHQRSLLESFAKSRDDKITIAGKDERRHHRLFSRLRNTFSGR